ncbi:cytochrome P450 [Mycolicibacterium flavescens]|uniref:Cytochrome n=1 Tax=Mycolicibacterium flavescens TaxID=1776 RepID=A0A1E3RLW5_MYCFV|nr:cytochrome P450 [Mycolicibacterium flavescens]MCV7281770.1 cytochrome P450 [Mycolicibacterium flavescens]ODQ90840.1 cytochrome [Mycolicibacterium flavescens]
MTTATVDLSDPALWANGFPHELFTRLRRETPVFHHPSNDRVAEQVKREFWVTTKHEHCLRLHRDTESFTASEGPLIQPLETFSAFPSIINMDPPDVNRRRKILSGAFTPRAVAKLEEGIRRRAKKMVDELYDAGGGDWVTQVAGLLPMTVIGDIVGIPQEDRPRIFTLLDDILMTKAPNSGVAPEDEPAIYMQIFEYAMNLTAEKRKNPTDDIWSALTTATATDDDGTRYALEENELEIFFFILGLAGADTTKNALTACLRAFEDNPDQLARYREDESVRSSAVEEVLRWTSPVAFWVRGAKTDIEIDGEPIPAGARVMSILASANRDEDVFADPFRFDITRSDNPHVTFGGGGPHYCLGAMLARAEIRAALDEILTRPASFTVGEPTVTHPNLTLNMNVFEHLPIEFTG